MQLAQINIAKMKWPIDDPRMAGFKDNLEPVNAMADKASGFVWRLQGEEDNALAIKVFEDDFLIINMSVWDSLESVFDFIYKTDHKYFIRDKKSWFNNMTEMHMALWFIEDGLYPSPESGKERLTYLQQNGPTPFAFNFKERFTEEEYLSWKNQ